MRTNSYILAREFKNTVEREFIPRVCCPRINWRGAYEHFLRQYSLQKADILYEEFMKI